MGLLADPGFADALTGALADEAWAVRAMAAKAIGRLGTQAAIPKLAERMSDREWWVRSNAGDALRALGPAGRAALIRTLDAADTYARHQAVAQLEEGGIIDEYVADLASPDAARRIAAIAFVEKVIALGRVDRLSHQAVAHTQESVRRKLLEVLKRVPEGAS
jgi:HEAT repeat protein